MTDNEIKKAWECCSAPICNCKECPMEGVNNCYTKLKYKTLDLINRQQAEIDKLQHKIVSCNTEIERLTALCTEQNEELGRLQKVRANILKVMKENISQTKTEAIKEFAERLKARIRKDIDEQGMLPLPYTKKAYDAVMLFIDNLVKEMTEQSVNYESSKITEVSE